MKLKNLLGGILLAVLLLLLPNKLQAQEIMSDLDVTYIERTPRYYSYCVNYVGINPVLCTGTENQKRWPELEESVIYRGHVVNKGVKPEGKFSYRWVVDGVVVKQGNVGSLDVGEELVLEHQTVWTDSSQEIKLEVDVNNEVSEISEENNFLMIKSDDLTLVYFVEQGVYDIFNETKNVVGSYSFEDWAQYQIGYFNRRLDQAKFIVTPDGVGRRVRIDRLVVTEELDGDGSIWNNDSEKLVLRYLEWVRLVTDGSPKSRLPFTR